MPVSAANNSTATNILDRYPWLSVALLVLFPFVLQLPFWLLGLSTDPIWFFSGITASKHVLPGAPFFDPNVGFNSEALGRLSALDWAHGIVPWWNSYTGVGMPLAGELQPGSFFLPFTLLLLLPDGLLWQRLFMQVIAGVCTYALLRELGLSRLAALMGGALFSLNGVIAWTPGPAAVYCSGVFLPLLLWGIERARRPGQGAQSMLAVGVAIGWSLLAGFPEPAYINGLLALGWGLYRLAGTADRWRFARRALTGAALGLMIASPLLISFVDYLLQSDSLAKHSFAGTASLAWAAFAATFIPIIYGPPGVDHSSETLNGVWGSIGGYTSLLVILLAIVGLRRGPVYGLRLLLVGWILVCWARSFGVEPFSWLVNHLPLLGKSAFYRYAPSSWILALTILASFGLDNLSRESLHRSVFDRRLPFSMAALLSVLCLALAWPYNGSLGREHHGLLIKTLKTGLVLGFTAVELTAAWSIWSRMEGEARRAALAFLLTLDAALMFLMPLSSAKRHGQVDIAAIAFLAQHQGLLRNFTLGPLQPNYGAYFQIASADHNVLPVPKLWADYADAHLLPGLEKRSDGVILWPDWEGYGQQAGEQIFNERIEEYSALGVRYLITNPNQDPTLASQNHKVFSDGLMDIWELPNPAPYFETASGGPCTITAAERERLSVDCAAPATILRRELFMPGWQVTANGGKSQAVGQSGIFETAAVPAGHSDLRYRFTPPYIGFGWAACSAGLLGLLWQAVRIGAARGGRAAHGAAVTSELPITASRS